MTRTLGPLGAFHSAQIARSGVILRVPIEAPMCVKGCFGGAGIPVMGHSGVEGKLL
jgi:hypothetical protein